MNSHSSLTDIKVILYDLDGTVYDDTAQFDYYANCIERRIAPERRAEFRQRFSQASVGADPEIPLGRFYHHPTRSAMQIDAAGRLIAGDRGGRPLTAAELAELPANPGHDGYTVFNVGDLWGISACLGRQYDLPQEELRACFTETRAFMASDQFQIRPIPGLVEAMQHLKGKVGQVLGTNSPQDASRVILTKTRMLELMDGVYYSCNKPFGLPELIERIKADYGVRPDQILSVGDNLPNEIAPARQMGARTAFIDPHGVGGPEDADIYVANMRDLVPVLRSLA